jgi:large subunit ribosomal protein L6
MSRLGKRPIPLPAGVTVKVSGQNVTVTGKGGTLSRELQPGVTITASDREVEIGREDDSKKLKEQHGLSWALVRGMVEGVSQGFKKELEIVGVGWNAKMQGNLLVLQIGFCHTVDMQVPSDVKLTLVTPQKLEITGIDKQAVGQFAAEIRAVRPPEPYKGKGIRYVGEHVERKVGKSQVGK